MGTQFALHEPIHQNNYINQTMEHSKLKIYLISTWTIGNVEIRSKFVYMMQTLMINNNNN